MNYIIKLQSKEHKTNNLDASTKKKTCKSPDLGHATSVQSCKGVPYTIYIPKLSDDGNKRRSGFSRGFEPVE